jgi:hypothetical protein
MEQRPSCKTNRFSASQEFPLIYGIRRFITAVRTEIFVLTLCLPLMEPHVSVWFPQEPTTRSHPELVAHN